MPFNPIFENDNRSKRSDHTAGQSLAGGIAAALFQRERSGAGQLVIPMAISLGYGVLLAAVVTLFLVPCGYVILGDLLGPRARREAPGASPERAAPATGRPRAA